MANRERGDIPLVIDGKAYTLVLNTNAMATLEEHFSTPQTDVLWDQIWTRVLRGSVKTIRALIWAMLQEHHPTITIEAASKLIDRAGGFAGLTEILTQAGKSTMPDPEDAKELDIKRPRPAQGARRRGTGGVSTSTRAASV